MLKILFTYIFLILVSIFTLQASETIHIGVLAPVTGEMKKEGMDIIRSARIIADQLNYMNGPSESRVEIKFRNSGSSKTSATLYLQSILEKKTCSAIILGDTENINRELSFICREKKIPYVIVNRFQEEKPGHYSHTTHPSHEDMLASLMLWLDKNRNSRDITIILNHSETNPSPDKFTENQVSSGRNIQTLFYNGSPEALRIVLDQLKQKPSQILMVMLQGNLLSDFLRGIQDHHGKHTITAPFLSHYSAENIGAFGIQGVISMLPWTRHPGSEYGTNSETIFLEEYTNRYHRYPGSSGLYTASSIYGFVKKETSPPFRENPEPCIVMGNDAETIQNDPLHMNFFTILNPSPGHVNHNENIQK